MRMNQTSKIFLMCYLLRWKVWKQQLKNWLIRPRFLKKKLNRMVIGLTVLFANVILQDQSHKLAIGWQGSANADQDLKVASVKSARKASMVIPTWDASLAIVVLMDQDLPIAILRLVNVNLKVKFWQQFCLMQEGDIQIFSKFSQGVRKYVCMYVFISANPMGKHPEGIKVTSIQSLKYVRTVDKQH